MKTSLVFALFCVHLSLCWSQQAPGDEDDRCTVNHSNPPQYPDNVTNLMDSYNYENLLPGNGTGNSPIATAVWNDFSFDGNDVTPETLSPTYWQQGAGGICRFQTRVCGWRRNMVIISQNNWLFTQHISSDFDSNIYNYDVTIHVEAIYSLQSCRLRQGCIQSFNLLHYMTNSQQLPSTSGNGYINTQNYVKFAVPEGPVSSVTYTNTYSFPLPPSSTGFYIAVQDIGSCIALSRLRVYRNNCKSRQVGLVRYPDAPAPVSGSANIDIGCVENAVVSGTPIVTCDTDGTWGSQNPVCQCKCGYEPNSEATRCNACSADYWSDGTVCLQCPANTKTTPAVACSCPCEDGYFRNNETSPEKGQYENPVDEDFTYGCTKPPSAPSGVLLSATNTSITARWSAPADLGERTDLYYQAEISDPDNLGSYIGTVCVPGSTEKRIFTGLRPCTDYCVRVTSENGVSDQDPASKDSRTETQCIKTKEGWFGPVKDLQCFEQVVVWERPETPRDCELDQYQVIVRKDDMEIQRFDREQSFLVLENTPELRGVSGALIMEVVAFNEAGPGESICKIRADLNENGRTQCTIFGCNECPEQTRTTELVRYPKTTVGEGAECVNVTAACVENAVSPLMGSPSLEVTCCSGGGWRVNEELRCKCIDNYKATESGTCIDAAKCPTCPENITASVTEDCTDLILTWSPVDGARQYSVRLHENGVNIINTIVNDNLYKASLINGKIKDKTLTFEIAALLSSSNEGTQNNRTSISIDTKGLCAAQQQGQQEDQQQFTTTQFSIGLAMTFVVTGPSVFFLTCVICLMVGSYRKKKYGSKFSTTYTMEEKNLYD